MAEVRYSVLAEDDLDGIAGYTVKWWSVTQAAKYLTALEACFGQLAEGTLPGRACDHIRPGLLRWEHESHVVFFRKIESGVRIVRVLGERQQPERHDFDEAESDDA